jgi:hypothetical protein
VKTLRRASANRPCEKVAIATPHSVLPISLVVIKAAGFQMMDKKREADKEGSWRVQHLRS